MSHFFQHTAEQWSSLWGHAGYASRKIPLKSVKAVRLEVLPKPE